jgi:hypothetical protein
LTVGQKINGRKRKQQLRWTYGTRKIKSTKYNQSVW